MAEFIDTGDACESCDFSPIPTSEYKLTSRGPTRLCELCACTFFSTALEYPAQVSDPKLYRSIAYGLNKILHEVKKNANSTER